MCPAGESGPERFDPDDVIRASEEVLISEFDDETVILDTRSDTYYGVNTVGAYVWDLLSEPLTVREIEEATIKRFEAPQEECRSDVRAFLDQLLEAGLAERV